jgi:glycosyltransferase involved in cell wall biosynthesis
MKRLLVLNFFPAFRPPASGGEQRYFYLYKWLSAHFDVTLLSPTYAGTRYEIVSFSSRYREYRVPKEAAHNAWHARLEAESIGPECSGLVCALATPEAKAYQRAYRELIGSADIVIHECPHMAGFDTQFGLDGKPRVYNSYNVEALLAADMFQGPKRERYISTITRLERNLVANTSLIFATSQEERKEFTRLYGCDPNKIVVVPNGFERRDVSTAGTDLGASLGIDGPFVFFIGSAHPPNIEAARLLCREVAPKLRDVLFVFSGAVCHTLDDTPPNVRCLGLVAEAEKAWLLDKCSVALNPVVSGAGTNLKIIDYMAGGKAILSTPFGARGLSVQDDVHLLIRDLRDFPTALNELLEDAKLRQRLGAAAVKLANREYRWDRIAARACAALTGIQVRGASGARRSKPRVLVLNDFPAVSPKGGGELRMYNLYKRLAETYEVTLLCLTNAVAGFEIWTEADFRQIAAPKTAAHRDMEEAVNRAYHVSASDIVAALNCCSNPELVLRFRNLSQLADLVICSHPYLSPLLELLPAPRPVIYEAHNGEATLKAQILRNHPLADGLLKAVENIERFACRKADRIVCVSREERNAFAASWGSEKVAVVLNGVRIPETIGASASPGRPRAAFLGSAHSPNIEAVEFLLSRVAPELPEADFVISGTVCEAFGNRPIPENVKLHGFLTESAKDALLASCAIGVNPMFSGAGSNLKMAQFLGAGLPCVSTAFGARGYDVIDGEHVVLADADQFAARIRDLLASPAQRSAMASKGREYALARLSWDVLGDEYRAILDELLREAKTPIRPKSRLLAVTYRYTDPPKGGAEAYLRNVLAQVAAAGDFSIDLATLEVTEVENWRHFSAQYGYRGPEAAGPDPAFASRTLRFPVEMPDSETIMASAQRLWDTWLRETREQARHFLSYYDTTTLMGGWYGVEKAEHSERRWTGPLAEVYCPGDVKRLLFNGTVPVETRVRVRQGAEEVFSGAVSGVFSIAAPLSQSASRILTIETDAIRRSAEDPRRLGLYVDSVIERTSAGDRPLPLTHDFEKHLRTASPEQWTASLIDLAQHRSEEVDELFYRIRGPHSDGLADFLEKHASDYDVVLIQGVPFSISVWATRLVKRCGRPVALLPHLHMEDRYYHWRTFYDAFRAADLILAFPDAVIPYVFDKIGAHAVPVAGGGIEPGDFAHLQDDREEFARLRKATRPFVLVLGRKNGAKNYKRVIEAVEALNCKGVGVDVVMIGPDEDKEAVSSRHVTTLGVQSRSVVVGAIASCVGLVNMSESESFGIVVLEAWMCKRPVIVNRDCLAFAALVRDGYDGYLCRAAEEVAARVEILMNDARLASELGERGYAKASGLYAWSSLGRNINQQLLGLVKRSEGDVAAVEAS